MATRQVNINTNVIGADQVERLKRNLVDTNKASLGAASGLSKIGEALAAKTVPEMTAYAELWKKSSDAAKAFQGIAKNAVESVAATVKRQQDLSKFYGTSIFTTSMINLNSAARNFVSQGGKGFTNWLQSGIGQLAQYRTALAAAGAAFVAFSAAAALNSKQNLYAIDSYMESMSHRIGDKGATRAWIEQAQKTDWSVGRTGRAALLDSMMTMPNFQISAEEGQRVVEDIEKYWFANQERLKARGVASAEDLGRRLAEGSFSQEENIALFGKYGLAMSKAAAPGRMAMMSDLSSGIDIDKEMEKRPEVVLRHRLSKITSTTGDMMIGPMNKVLGLVLKIGEAINKIPGADKFVGWGLMFGTAATGALLLVSAVGGMVPLLLNGIRLLHLGAIASKAYAAATNLASVATKLFQLALVSTGVGALIVLAGVLVAVAYKTGLLQKAWDKLKRSAFGKAVGAGLGEAAQKAMSLFGWMDRLFGRMNNAMKSSGSHKMLLSMALGPIAVPFLLLGKLLPDMANRIKKLVEGSDALQRLFQFGNSIAKRISEFIEKLVGLFSAAKDLIQNVLDALPGAEKRKAEAALAEQAAKYGLEYKNGQFFGVTGGTTAGNVTEDYVKKNYPEVFAAIGTARFHNEMSKVGLTYNQQNPGGWYQLGGTGGTYGALDQSQVPADLWAQHTATEAMPGFWGEVLQALTDLPQKIAEALQSAMPSVFGTPALSGDALSKAFTEWASGQSIAKARPESVSKFLEYMGMPESDIEARSAARSELSTMIGGVSLDEWIEKYGELSNGTPPVTTRAAESAKGAVGTVTDIDTYTGAPKTAGEAVAQGAAMAAIPGYGIYKLGEGLYGLGKSGYKRLTKADAGGPVLSDGPLIGHEFEEVDPANVVRGGKTTLARINEMVGSGFGGGGGIVNNISMPVTLNVDRVSSDMDFDRMLNRASDKLLFNLRNELEHNQARSHGSLRGGSIK